MWKSGSRLVVEMGDGARYRMAIMVGVLGVIKEIKSPCDCRGFKGLGLGVF